MNIPSIVAQVNILLRFEIIIILLTMPLPSSATIPVIALRGED
jgi:hypothetical protein